MFVCSVIEAIPLLLGISRIRDRSVDGAALYRRDDFVADISRPIDYAPN